MFADLVVMSGTTTMEFSQRQRQIESLSVTNSNPVSSRHKIIVGIDYGTTFSGVSYVTTNKSDIDDIKVISKWPGNQHTSWKTPTRIAYQVENPRLSGNKWGFEVTPKLTSYSWTKLLLDKNAHNSEFDDPSLSSRPRSEGIMKLPSFRDASGVCEDFLHEIYEYISATLRRHMTDATYDATPMECWVTLPAIWSEEAKVATLEAAKRAGFANRPNDEIFTIAEPEAAAIATLKLYARDDTLNPVKPNDHILICDCGGGTVDIITYTISQVEPVLQFDELCVGIGGKCGSTYIDRNLHTLLSEKFGTAFDEITAALKGPESQLMACFEGIKKDFGVNDFQDDVALSPIKLDLFEDVDSYDEEEHTVTLKYDEMRGLFDPVIEEITSLVGQQVQEAKEKHNAIIDRIILVGGFGESPYLNKALKKWCTEHSQIALMCPEHPQSAVVRGAALRGLAGVVPRIKKARRHYGVGVSFDFVEGTDPEKYARLGDFDDRKTCDNRIIWLVSKGSTILEDTVINEALQQPYTAGTSTSACIKLLSSALDDPPRYSTNSRVEKVGEIISSFPSDFDYGRSSRSIYSQRLGKVVSRFNFTVQVRFGDRGENLVFKTLVNGDIVSTAVINFNRT